MNPVLSIEKRVKCLRCDASGKIQNPRPGADFVDCPTCLGEGLVLSFAPLTEAALDEAIELGVELAELRRAKETALLAAAHMLRVFAGIRAALADLGDEPIAKSASRLASEGEAQAAALITLLRGVGVQ